MSNLVEEESVELEEEEKGDVPAPLVSTQTQVLQISGRLGLGKTWTLVSETFSACKAYGLKRIITNVKLLRAPEGVEVVYTTDIREVFKHLEDGVPTALAFDELSKSVNSRLAKSTFNLVIVRLLGDVRKSGVRFFGYTHQARKESDTLVRSNNSYILYPRHRVNVDGYPIYWVWRDNEQFELDFKRGDGDYRFATPMLSKHILPEIDDSYNTFEKIPLTLNPGLTEAELPGAIDEFLSFCQEHSISLSGQKPSAIKMFLKRWNENAPSHAVPYTPKALDVMLSEILARGLLDVKTEVVPKSPVSETSELESSDSESKPAIPEPLKSQCYCGFVPSKNQPLEEHLTSFWNLRFSASNITGKKQLLSLHPHVEGESFETWKAKMIGVGD